MKKFVLPLLLLVALPAFGQTVAIDRQGNVQNATVKFDGTTHTLWVDNVEITGAAMTDARPPLAHAASHASAGGDPLTLAMTQITGLVAALAGKSDTGHTHAFTDLTGKPTTIEGYGITNLYALGDARWALLSHTHAQADVTNLVSDLAGKVPTTRTVNGHALTGNIVVTKSDVGLGNAEDTSDLAKPVSTAQQAVLDGKANTSHSHAGADITSGTISTARLGSGTANSGSFLRGDQTWTAVTVPTIESTSNLLKGDGAGNAVAATGGTDYATAAHTHTGSTLSGIDISDDTNLAGTTNEVTLTGDTLSLAAAITRDTEWDTPAEIEAATGVNFILSTEIDSTAEINALTADADFPTLTANNIFSGNHAFSSASAASTSATIYTGAWFTGGTSTTNFPHFLIQPAGATASSTWSTSGTAIGVNAVSGFSGNLIDLKLAGATKFNVRYDGWAVSTFGMGFPTWYTTAGAASASSGITIFGVTNGIAITNNFQVTGGKVLLGATGLTEESSGVLQINSGTQNTYRDLKLRSTLFAGSTSGTTTVQAPAVAGSAVVTWPSTTGTLALSGANADITSLSGLTTPLSVAQGGTGLAGSAWTSYTPTVTSGGGTITSYTVNEAKYEKVGKTVRVRISFTITNVGSASGEIRATLPPSSTSAYGQAVSGVGDGAGGNALMVWMDGAATYLRIRNYDNTFYAANGYTYLIGGVYESQ